MDASRDVVPGVVLVAIGAFLTWQAASIHYVNLLTNDPLGPDTVPEALGVLLIVTGAALVARPFVRRRLPDITDDDEPAPGSPGTGRVALTVLACVVFLLLLPVVGFAITGPLFVAALVAIVAGRSRLPLNVTIAVLASATAYLVFAVVVGIDLPLFPGA